MPDSELEGQGLTKAFDGVVANDHVDFRLSAGEVHAVLGENGAGKTTLMNLFYGLLQPDEGQILVRGQPVQLTHPAIAIRHGIGMVHQHLMLIPHLTVAENVVLGREIIDHGFLLDMVSAERRVREISQQYGFEVDPAALVEKLPMGVRQRIEIIKVLYRQADILILDEPTALLTPLETEELFGVVRSLVEQGKSIIFITHKLKEVFQIADRITILRNGRVVATTTPAETHERSLAEMMVGRQLAAIGGDRRARPPVPGRKPLLEVRDLCVLGPGGRLALDGVSLDLAPGEILGVAGVEGNGQMELLEALIRLRPISGGDIVFDGTSTLGLDPKGIRRLGVGVIPDDRQRLGLVLPFQVSENLVLDRYDRAPFSAGLAVRWDRVRAFAGDVASAFDIRAASLSTSVSTLSGGNQQKVVLGRELSEPLRLLIAAQPTRGIDVASVEFVHAKILEASQQGTAVLLISSDLDEILRLADRVLVLLRGRAVGLVEAHEATKELLGQLMLGVVERSASPGMLAHPSSGGGRVPRRRSPSRSSRDGPDNDREGKEGGVGKKPLF